MVRFNWLLAALACAILGALPILASCEADDPPGPTTDDNFPLCEGNKSDDPSCPVALPGEDASPTDAEAEQGSQPDTAPSEPQKPAVDYTGQYCPNKGCTLIPSTASQAEDAWDRWDCVPDGTTAMPTAGIPQLCGF